MKVGLNIDIKQRRGAKLPVFMHRSCCQMPFSFTMGLNCIIWRAKQWELTYFKVEYSSSVCNPNVVNFFNLYLSKLPKSSIERHFYVLMCYHYDRFQRELM